MLTPIVGEQAMAIADRLLTRFGSIGAVLAADPLIRARIAEVASVARFLDTLRSFLLLSLRDAAVRQPVLGSNAATVDYLRALIGYEPVEQLRALFLDIHHHLLSDELIYRGQEDTVSAEAREIIRRALEVGARGIVLAHNHPGGSATASQEDVEATRRISQAAQSVGIVVHDHLIVTRYGWSSMRSDGLLGA